MQRKLTPQEFKEFKRTASLRQIEIICLLVQIGSITETARSLGISAAAVTRIVQSFEGHFQFPIFVKKRQGIALSADGEELVAILQEMMQTIDSVAQQLVAE